MYSRFTPIGSIISTTFEDGALLIDCANGKARIRMINDTLLQIQVVPKGEKFSDKSYAVQHNSWVALPPALENKEVIEIHAGIIHLTIRKQDFHLTFKDQDHKEILSSEKGLGIQFQNAGFTQYWRRRKDEKYVGLGEKTGPLNKAGKQYTNWNTDSYGYGPDSDPLYATVPFYIGLHDNCPYGLFYDNTSRTTFNFGASNHRFASVQASSGQLNFYFMYGGDVRSILSGYQLLTGKAPLPPKWSLGYQQCRYSYYPQNDVIRLAQTFRDKKIPCDVLYLDIHYMDAYKVFTWHPEFFPEPEKMLDSLNKMGFKVVVILDPGIKVEEDYQVYTSGIKKDVFVKYVDGEIMEADVWPGKCHFPDFTAPKARKWWSKYVADLKKEGIDGFWNDMNEPACWGNAFPDATIFDMDGQKLTHADGRNVYGMQMSRSTYEGAHQNKDKRSFILTRAAFAGSHRYTAIWTGDNVSNAEHLLLSARMIANLGLAGFPFAGPDAGGFVGECSPELFRRWIALSAFFPLFRSHTMINTKSAEPWSFGEETEEVARMYIQLRYKLLPYLYSLFDEYSISGIPPVRSLFIDHYSDEDIYNPEFENQFYLGPSLLICPVIPGDYLKKVYLPEGKWYDFYNDTVYEGSKIHIIEVHPHRIPVFVKEGAIIPMHTNSMEYIDAVSSQEVELHIYGLKKENSFSWYEDDGSTMDYLEKNYHRRVISINPDEKNIKFFKVEGKYSSITEKIRICLHGVKQVTKFRIKDKLLTPEIANYHFVKPVSNFDPFDRQKDNSHIIFGLLKLTIPYKTQQTIIEFIKD